MVIRKIPHNKNGLYTIFEASDIEFCNPIDYYSELYINMNISVGRELLLANKFPFPKDIMEKVLLKKGVEEWKKKYQEHIETEIPVNILSLLQTKTKDEQIKLLKGQSLTPDQLIAFILKAWTDYGYTFSQYSVEHQPKDLNTADFPKIVVVKEDKVEKVGNTNLSDGQLKHAMKYRQVIVSKFLDNGANWHCLFITYKSLRGDETWKDGQPHFHYISDKFGIQRDVVVNELKSKNYKLGSLPHIDLINYRDKK